MGNYSVMEYAPGDIRRIVVKAFLCGLMVGIVVGMVWRDDLLGAVKMLCDSCGVQ